MVLSAKWLRLSAGLLILILASAGCDFFSKKDRADEAGAPPPAATSGAIGVPAGVTPGRGPLGGGTAVTIAGTNLSAASAIFFGGRALNGATFDPATGTIGGFAPPSTVAGPVDVTNEEAGATATLASGFIYDAPRITHVSLTTDLLAGGSPITVTGTGFSATTVIRIGGIALLSASVSGNTISGLVPPRSAPGAVPITAEEGGAAIASEIRFIYLAPAPTFDSISPEFGRAAGGAHVFVTGTNFDQTTRVEIDRNPLTITVPINDRTMIVVIPPGTRTGLVDVTIRNDFGGTVAAQKFTYIAAEITSIGPQEGTLAGGTKVVIRGQNLSTDAVFRIGGEPLEDLVVLSPEEVSGKAPAGIRLGPADVTAEEGGVRPSVLKGAFTYVGVQFVAVPNAGTSDVTVLRLDDSATPPVAQLASGSPFGLGARRPQPVDAVHDPARRLLFVANRIGGSLTVFRQTDPLDPSTFARTAASPVPLGPGARPFALLLNPAKQVLYVADPGRNVVSPFTYDAAGTLTAAGDRTLPASRGPSSLALFTGTGGVERVFAGDAVTTDIYVLDLDGSGVPTSAAFFARNFTGPNGLAVFNGPASAALYVTDSTTSAITTYGLDPATGELLAFGTEDVGAPGNRSLLIVPFGVNKTALVVANEEAGELRVFSISPDGATLTATNARNPTPARSRPSGLARVGHRLFTASADGNELVAFDMPPDDPETLNLSPTAAGSRFSVAPGTVPLVARTPDGFRPGVPSGADPVFTVNRGTGNVSAFDLVFDARGLALREFPGSPFAVEDEAGIAAGASAAGALFLGAGAGALDALDARAPTGFLSFLGVESQTGGALTRVVARPVTGGAIAAIVLAVDPAAGLVASFTMDPNGTLAAAGTLAPAPITAPADLGFLGPDAALVLGDATGAPALATLALDAATGALSSGATALLAGGAAPSSMLLGPVGPTGAADLFVADGRPLLTRFAVSPTAIAVMTSTATALGPGAPAVLALAPLGATRSALYAIGQDGAPSARLLVSGFDAATLEPLPNGPYPIRPEFAGDVLAADDVAVFSSFLYVAVRGDAARGGRNFVHGFRIGPDGALSPLAFSGVLAPLGQFPAGGTGRQRLRVIGSRLFVVTAGVRDGVADPEEGKGNDAVLALDLDPVTGALAQAAAISVAPGNDPIDAVPLK